MTGSRSVCNISTADVFLQLCFFFDQANPSLKQPLSGCELVSVMGFPQFNEEFRSRLRFFQSTYDKLQLFDDFVLLSDSGCSLGEGQRNRQVR
jgi:hypothetical protein